ncbi:hypothetical protein [Actinomadura sp. 9N215]|uniref:hypothetical protein n=1 Tax=Actinomadura sp. 9N215 TaxID=3375150 RepID=UPI0037A19440
MAQANDDQGPDVISGESDLRTAEALGKRVAEVTHVHARDVPRALSWPPGCERVR